MSETFIFTVEPEDAGQRLDKFLSTRQPSLSRSYVQQLLADNCVTRNGATITGTSAKVKPGETYQLTIPEVAKLDLEPVAMQLDIVFEDEHLLVINKPVGLAVHPAPGTFEPTLVHGLLAHCGESLSGIGGVARPGIVHRIDKDTSGLLVVAKTDQAHQHLSAQLKDRILSRVYTAFCWGVPIPSQGTIDAPIGRHPTQRTRMAVVKSGGKDARTHYQVDEVFTAKRGREVVRLASKITCKLESGRTHQIRVHLSHIGHGLIGDQTYGNDTASRLRGFGIALQNSTDCFLNQYRRQALHASMLTLSHPITKEVLTFSVSIPEDMQALANAVRDLHME